MTSQLRFAIRLLKQATPTAFDTHDPINILEAIANARLGLTVTADWLHLIYCSRTPLGGATSHPRQLVDAAAAVCDQTQLLRPREFIFKLINKRYGLDALKEIATKVEWVLPVEARPRPGQVCHRRPYQLILLLLHLYRIFYLDF